MNPEILLVTFNARYSHASLGLRYLYANMDELRPVTEIYEATIADDIHHVEEQISRKNPKILGLGIYIWNFDISKKLISMIRKRSPQIKIVIGGPEVSHGVSDDLAGLVDYIAPLEADLSFAQLCREHLSKRAPKEKFISSSLPDLQRLSLPYQHYSQDDLAHRKIYVETSRGCVFKCQFCLSSLDEKIRTFDLDLVLSEFRQLYSRGARHFKFVDRTFNLDIKQSQKILNFFLELSPKQDFFLHFEVIPDRFPSGLKDLVQKFKPGVLQFEVGIQTFDEKVSSLIGRKQSEKKCIENIKFLREETHAHIHTDLIVGLPFADKALVKRDLNKLVDLNVQEIQVGILKLLKGAPISQHIEAAQLKFGGSAPYEIISTKDILSEEIDTFKFFSKYWDRYFNSGDFNKSIRYLFKFSDPFTEFWQLTEYLKEKYNRAYGISLENLSKSLYEYLIKEKGCQEEKVKTLLRRDWCVRPGRKIPRFLKDGSDSKFNPDITQFAPYLSRQLKHLKS